MRHLRSLVPLLLRPPSSSPNDSFSGQNSSRLARPRSLIVKEPSLAGLAPSISDQGQVTVVSGSEVRLSSGLVVSVAPDVHDGTFEHNAKETSDGWVDPKCSWALFGWFLKSYVSGVSLGRLRVCS